MHEWIEAAVSSGQVFGDELEPLGSPGYELIHNAGFDCDDHTGLFNGGSSNSFGGVIHEGPFGLMVPFHLDVPAGD